MDSITSADAFTLATGLEAGWYSSVDLVAQSLQTIASHGELGAFITVIADDALDAAAKADQKRRAGEATTFTGVPIAVKGLTAVRGVPLTMGPGLLADSVAEADAPIVTRVREAGFVVVGTTNTPEFGLSSFTDNDLVGSAVTPWDTSRNAGGSSGGSAAAVAAGLVPLALGSDGGGSIRIPASCCGVFGYKPSRGLVDPGLGGSAWTGLVTDGVLTRTVRDAAAVLEIIAERPLGRVGIAERLRVARWCTPYLDFAEASSESIAAVDRATEVLTFLGHEVIDIPNPWPPELEAQFNVVWSSAMAAVPISPEAAPLLRRTTRYWREFGSRPSATDLASAMTYLEQTTAAVLAGLRDVDVFLTPTLALPPQPTRWFTDPADEAEIHRRELLFTPYTALMNMSGQPAASLPLYVTPATPERPALPVGVMLAAHRGDDARLLELCRQVEAAAGFSLLGQ